MLQLKPISIIVLREFKRFFRQKGRLWSSLARPLFWLFVVGPGFDRLLGGEGGISYQQFIFPGVLGIVVLFGAILSSLSTVYDREFGVVRIMLIAPVSRLAIVLGKVVGGTMLAVFQALLLLILVPFLKLPVGPLHLLLLILFLFLTSFAIASLGMLMATRIDSLENFATIMNFVVFPMFFLSGGLYPVKLLPGLLQIVVYFNPLTYGIDLFKHVLLPHAAMTPMGADLPTLVDLATLSLFAVIMLLAATALFDKEAKLVRLSRRGV
ncbi:MAG: ABC transporter permease [candidate division NC10 bacterium]|nr:ABC transporter permease [candidate division NC10 bacterium]